MFVTDLQDMIAWTHEPAILDLSKEDLVGEIRARLLTLTQQFVAYPHCANFSLMAEPAAIQ